HRPIWALGDAGPRRHAIALRQRHADGEHAGLAAIRDANDQPGSALRVVRSSRTLPRRRYHSGLGPTGRHARHRFGLFPFRDEPLPSRHFRELTPIVEMKAVDSDRMKRKAYEKELGTTEKQLGTNQTDS